MRAVIEVNDLSKLYRLGEVGTGTLSHDLKRWVAKVRGHEDPFSKVGQVNDRTINAEKDEYVWALRDLNFKLSKGDVVGIVGRNGAGKSTLLKILSRITAPSTGEVKIKGRIASLLEVGTGFHPEMTGRENVYMNGTVMGMRKHEVARKFDEIVEFAGVARYIDTPVKRYSSGMTVRLGFSVAAFLEPEILIVDEVLAVGDAEFQRKALGKMKDVSEGEGRTVLFVSHNMAAIRRLCTTGLYLKNGHKILYGNIDLAITEYLKDKDLGKIISTASIGGIQVKNVLFKDESNAEIKTFCTHDNISIVLQCKAGDNFKNLNFAVGFNNVFETRVMTLWSSYIGKEFDIKQGEFEIVFHVKNIKLLPGEYYIATYVASRGQQVERIDNFIKISVSFVEKYGLVVEPQTAQGYYLEDFNVDMV